jgi:hypothetical protein
VTCDLCLGTSAEWAVSTSGGHHSNVCLPDVAVLLEVIANNTLPGAVVTLVRLENHQQ